MSKIRETVMSLVICGLLGLHSLSAYAGVEGQMLRPGFCDKCDSLLENVSGNIYAAKNIDANKINTTDSQTITPPENR